MIDALAVTGCVQLAIDDRSRAIRRKIQSRQTRIHIVRWFCYSYRSIIATAFQVPFCHMRQGFGGRDRISQFKNRQHAEN